nr:MAG: structural protein [Totiviridae sp.]
MCPYTTQYYQTQLQRKEMAPTQELVAELLQVTEEMVPLHVETGTDHIRVPSDGEVFYIVEYNRQKPVRVAACGARGLFIRTREEEFFRSPMGSSGVTQTLIFNRKGLQTSTGTVAALTPFCAVVDSTGEVVRWLVNGVEKPKDYFKFRKGVLPAKLTGKGLLPTQDLKSVMIGYHTPVRGNGCRAALKFRTWGPPVIGVAPVGDIGTEVKKTLYIETILADQKPNPEKAIGSRPDVLESGYLQSYLLQVALSAPPPKTTMAMPLLKLCLYHRWGSFASREPERTIVMSGQAQVHEPDTTMEPGTPFIRLLNASGMALEDCGGTARPSFPFMYGHQRGTISFYADPQIPVANNETPLVIPWAVWSTQQMAIVAAFIMMFAPWPCANLSLGIKTKGAAVSHPCMQTFSWFGTTLALPGELHLSVVIPRPTAANLAAPKWTLPFYPTFGPTAVHHYAPFAPIPVVFQESPGRRRIYLSDFCVSWVSGIRPFHVETLLGILEKSGFIDMSERWAIDAITLFSNHAGVMATGPCDPGAGQPPSPDLPDTVVDKTDDPVPITMRCWRDVGDRMAHVPPEANWTDWQPAADWSMPLPDLRTISGIGLGVYEFVERTLKMQAHALLAMPYVAAAIQVAAERRFVGWKQVHAAVGASYETYQLAHLATVASSGERTVFDDIFSPDVYTLPRLHKLVSGAQKAVSGAPPLEVVRGHPALNLLARPERWDSLVWDLTTVRELPKVLVGCLPDLVMYNWCDSVPQEDMPFVITTCIEGGTRPLEETGGKATYPPDGFNGPLLTMPHYQAELGLNDMADPTVADIWMNRLVLFLPDYYLAEFVNGDAAAGAPRPGQVPIPLSRREDAWRRLPNVDQLEFQQVYPNLSTTWMPWTDSQKHRVTALLFQGHSAAWRDLLRTGQGGQASGVTWDDTGPPLSWYRVLGTVGPNLKSIQDRWSGNGEGGDTKQPAAADSPTVSSDPPTTTSQAGAATD